MTGNFVQKLLHVTGYYFVINISFAELVDLAQTESHEHYSVANEYRCF